MEKSNDKAQSVSEIIELIKNEFSSLIHKSEKEEEIPNLWFRAENSNIDTPLIPNAFRTYGRVEKDNYKTVLDDTNAIEGNFKAEFSRKSTIFFNQNRIENNDWNQYFLMQHYGLKTRLLDWSESALIAVYFSVEDDLKTDDSKIWILNPYRLNKSSTKLIEGFETGCSLIHFPKSSKKEDLFNTERKLNLDELHRKYLEMDFESNKKSFPLAIYPYLFDERMKAQKACFTIFGNEVDGLLNNLDKEIFLKSILIDGNSKKKIKKELRWLGISKESVYPGLDSSCKDIQEKYN